MRQRTHLQLAGTLFGLTLISLGVLLGSFAMTVPTGPVRRERALPTLGEKGEDLDRVERQWSDRVTYPAGRFDPAWIRAAAAQDRHVRRAVPARSEREIYSRNTFASPTALDPNSFTSLGPQPLRTSGCSGCYSYGDVAGRVNDVVVDPTTMTDGSIVAYAGTIGGGVWKTTNCCSTSTTWSVLTDDPLISTVSIDALALDPHDHNTIYAGTGDLNFGSFSMGSHGILKSSDAGATWTLLGANVFGTGLPEAAGKFPQYQAVGKVRVDPRNSNNVVAGTKSGLYFSYDGGSNWTGPCLTNSFTSMRQDITGLALIDNGTSTKIIAAVGVRGFATAVQYNLDQNGANGIYKGTMPANACPNDFAPITTNANGWSGTNAASGTAYVNSQSGNQLGRIDIAVAPSNPNYIYAQVQSITKSTNSGCANKAGCQLGAWRSTDGGGTWGRIPGSSGASLRDCSNAPGDYNQNWFDQGIAIDPNNPNRAFFATFDVWFWAKTKKNKKWNDLTCSYNGSGAVVHADQHALTFVPGSSSILLSGNDGGVHATKNANATSATTRPRWFNMNRGFNTIEFYSGDISAHFASSSNPQATGGAQDNGASSVSYAGATIAPAPWQVGKGGDGFYARIDPVGLQFFQGNNGGAISRCVSNCTAAGASWSAITGGWSGDTKSFILPFDLFHGGIAGGDDCPAGGCRDLLAGTTRVWETISGAPSWHVTNNPASQNMTKQSLGDRSFINQVKYSPKFQSVAIAGTNDGNVWIGFNLGTSNAGQANWIDVTGANAILPNRPILGVALDASVAAPNTPLGYAAVGGFKANTPSTPGHVFQIACAANCASFTWIDKSGNLPDVPVDSVISNANVPQQVFAGTDFGLYFTNDITVDSPVWYRFENGLPHTMIWDMQIDRGATTLSVWTRGRGAYVWPLPTSAIPTP